jgi:hypothetical protein
MRAQELIGSQSRGMHVIHVEGSGCSEVLHWFLEQNLRVQLLPRYYHGEVFCLFVMFAQSELTDAERRASGNAYLMFRLAWRSPEKGVEWIEHSYPGTRLRSWRDP